MRVFLYIIRNEHKQKTHFPGFPGKIYFNTRHQYTRDSA